MCKYTLVFLLLILGIYADDRPIIRTKNGLVRGTYKKTISGHEYAAFEGIPFAKPPVDELRFKSPVPKEPWLGVWDANTKHTCIQLQMGPAESDLVFGNEDCLYINVYSPKNTDNKAKLDVIVHIHGGAFMVGSATMYEPGFLLDHDVIFVTFNYRLGPLGFLGTEDEVSPGNYGLKDQSLALKWIQENIASFGGNPKSVTITGCSAGGASVHFHYLSPMSKDLFARGISSSGTAANNWALIDEPLQQARKLGAAVGCEQTTTKDLVECLRQRPSAQLASNTKKLQPWLGMPAVPFGPIVEPKLNDAFITEHPHEMIRSGKVADVPWIVTVAKDEGLYPVSMFLYTDDRLPYLENNWEQLSADILHYDATLDKDLRPQVAQKIREHYLHNRPISTETFNELVQAVGDRLFVVDSEKAARLQAAVNKSPVYFSKFSYRGDHSITNFFSGKTDNLGVSHGDDLFYILTTNFPLTKYMESKNDKKLSKILTDMWIAYANTGKPELEGAKWKPVSKKLSDPLIYLDILGPENLTVKEANELGHRTFWDSLPLRDNGKLVITKEEL